VNPNPYNRHGYLSQEREAWRNAQALHTEARASRSPDWARVVRAWKNARYAASQLSVLEAMGAFLLPPLKHTWPGGPIPGTRNQP
jgi:hypothetical protein